MEEFRQKSTDFRNFKADLGVKTPVKDNCHIVLALSLIIRRLRRENDRIASEFHQSEGGSWPATQPNDNRQGATSCVIHGTTQKEGGQSLA